MTLFLLYGPAVTTAHDHWEDHSPDYADLCRQSNVSAFQHTVKVCHHFPDMKQLFSDLAAAVTIHSDFKAQEEEISHYFCFSPFYLHEVMGPDAMILVFLIFNFKSAV